MSPESLNITASKTFDEVLEQLPADEQAERVGVVSRRLAEQDRARVIAGRQEHEVGESHPASVEDLMQEILHRCMSYYGQPRSSALRATWGRINRILPAL